jgi:hypothetical protein
MHCLTGVQQVRKTLVCDISCIQVTDNVHNRILRNYTRIFLYGLVNKVVLREPAFQQGYYIVKYCKLKCQH